MAAVIPLYKGKKITVITCNRNPLSPCPTTTIPKIDSTKASGPSPSLFSPRSPWRGIGKNGTRCELVIYFLFLSDSHAMCLFAHLLLNRTFRDSSTSSTTDSELSTPIPYSGIGCFSVKGKGMDVMILCHSIDNRRFSITDVMDALYTEFLPNAAKTLGI